MSDHFGTLCIKGLNALCQQRGHTYVKLQGFFKYISDASRDLVPFVQKKGVKNIKKAFKKREKRP